MNIATKIVSAALLAITVTCLAAQGDTFSNIFEVELVSSTQSAVSINFAALANEVFEFHDVNTLSQKYQETGVGFTYEYGKPILPSVTRIVVVPPNAGLELSINVGEPQNLQFDSP